MKNFKHTKVANVSGSIELIKNSRVNKFQFQE